MCSGCPSKSPALRVIQHEVIPVTTSTPPATFDDAFSPAELALIEQSTQEIGRQVFQRHGSEAPGIFERRWWDDRIMAWAMQDESVKVQMFRFVDVLPMLHDSTAVVQHLHEYFDEVQQYLPSAARLGLSVSSPHSVAGRALAIAARRQASGQARRFIAGTNTEEVLVAARRERKLRRAFTLDVLGEAVTSESEAERYLQAYIDLIENIAPQANRWPEVPQVDRGQYMKLPRVNVSVKLSALDSQFDPIDPVGTTRRVSERLRRLLRVARGNEAYVHIDMESYHTKDLTLAIFKQVFMEDEFRATSDVGIVIQCYLRDAVADLIGLRDWARERGKPVWVRLVKGAYWDYETVHARATGWPIPVFQQKWQSDECFERCSRFVMRNHEFLKPALGSHNIRSLAHGIAAARHVGLPPEGYEIQMLYGMADAEKQAFVDMGHRVRVYMPYGELIPGMAYLVRRLLENTSNDSFLRASFNEHVSPEKLLMKPEPPTDTKAQVNEPASSLTVVGSGDTMAVQNEPPTDFAIESNRTKMQEAIDHVREQFGQSYPLVINGKEVETGESIASVDPSHHELIVGAVSAAGQQHANDAVGAAAKALPKWFALGAEGRAKYLRKAAEIMRGRRFELAAWIVHECGKSWPSADGDVTEAIDFIEFYTAAAMQMDSPHGVDVPGEENRFSYAPRGVAAVIAPWNFPLAILTGMTTASLVTGNTVVIKPAEQSSVVGAKLMEVFVEAGLPPGVVNYLPGVGEVVGPILVEHPQVALIAFTGSREVGLSIHRRAAEVSAQGLPYVKRVIAEMGGKNAIIVDDDADVDEAVMGVVESAFGFQGQKCSACSRAIVLADVYDVFLRRLVDATQSLKLGPAEDPGAKVGPLIDDESRQRVMKYIELAKTEGREVLAVDAGPLADQGYFVGPHIYADVAPDARIAQEEIFGPVLAVIRAKDFDEAIHILNDTDYGLTAGVFSRSPAHLDQARRELMVGNVYLNRGITGALVGRQPFGGFKMSGIGSKAGGSDYLLQFVVPRTVTENTMRRGFAPNSES